MRYVTSKHGRGATTMASISVIWDRTTEVLRGRLGMLATIAILLIFVPAVIQSIYFATVIQGSPMMFSAGAMVAAGAGAGTGQMSVYGLLSLVFSILRVWGSLALVAATLTPAVQSVGEAVGLGGKRLLPMIGLSILLVIAGIVLMIPFFAILTAGGFSFLALAHGGMTPGAGLGATIGIAFLYVLVLLVVFLWALARLFVFVPVLVGERLGVGTYGRSFQLTRGYTWRLIGVLLLLGIVAWIASAATSAVVGLIARLVMGADHVGASVAGAQIGSAAVSAAFAVVYAAFTAQFYRSRTGMEAAETFA